MAITTRTVTIGKEWTLVTNDVSAMVFNDTMEVFISHGGLPTSTDVGIKVAPGTPYKNCSPNINVYAKDYEGGTGVPSVRVIGDVV